MCSHEGSVLDRVADKLAKVDKEKEDQRDLWSVFSRIQKLEMKLEQRVDDADSDDATFEDCLVKIAVCAIATAESLRRRKAADLRGDK